MICSKSARALGFLLLLLAPGPALAQRDPSGNWTLYHEDQPHRIPGADLGDYTGIPLNDAGRLKADSWDASILTLREHQAKPHPSTYSLRGPANIRINRELDPVTQQVIGYELFGTFGQATRLIWLDGRPHPPGARRAHLGGLFDRPVGRQCAGGQDVSPQAGLAVVQRAVLPSPPVVTSASPFAIDPIGT